MVNDPPRVIHHGIDRGWAVDGRCRRCFPGKIVKALILLAPGKSPDAVLELEDIPAVGSHLSAAGNTYEIVRVGHAFDLDASGRLIHTVELEVRILVASEPS
jgi:hypothetical protein